MKKILCFIVILAVGLVAFIRSQTPIGVYSTGIPGAATLPTIPSSFIIYRAGVTNIGNLATSVAATFTTPLPTTIGTNYYVAISFDQTIASAVSAAATSKTTNGFTISLSAGIAGTTTIDYLAIPYQ
jgi:hypothetical protein